METLQKKRKKRGPRKRSVFALLRERIVDGYYPQGVKLTEQTLANEFSVSRLTIREVLGDLESQGLVEKKPNKGTVVRRIDSESLFETMEIREVLEGLAARLAAQKSKPEDWSDLKEEFGESFERIVRELDFEKYLDLISKFRDRMVQAAQNDELSKLINSLYAKIRIVQRRIVILPGRIQEAIEEHRQVLEAIMEGDPLKAEKIKKENLQHAREWLDKYKMWVL
jgi:DNA-binding GntR family transcriptional regulator